MNIKMNIKMKVNTYFAIKIFLIQNKRTKKKKMQTRIFCQQTNKLATRIGSSKKMKFTIFCTSQVLLRKEAFTECINCIDESECFLFLLLQDKCKNNLSII